MITNTLKRLHTNTSSYTLKVQEAQKMTKGDKKMTNGDGLMTLSTPFDYDGDNFDYKWAEIRDKLSLNSNVANARWFPEKLMPLFENVSSARLLTDKGRPTKLCAQLLYRYKAFVIDGGNDYKTFAEEVKKVYGDENGDGSKLVPVTVLGFGDDDYENGDGILSPNYGSSLDTMKNQIAGRSDHLESKITLVLQKVQQANKAEKEYDEMLDVSWQQEILEDELSRIEDEAEKKKREYDQKKREYDLRLKARQMLKQL